MRTHRFVMLILGMVFMLGQSGCSNPQDTSPEKPDVAIEGTISVYVVNYPLKYFAQRIGGPHVEVYFPAPADEDPAYWMPDSETISKYQQADLILLNGAGYEQWVQSASLPKSKLCNTSAGFAEDYIALEDVPERRPPKPRVEQGGVNRMEPESTPTVTRKKKTSE